MHKLQLVDVEVPETMVESSSNFQSLLVLVNHLVEVFLCHKDLTSAHIAA